MYGKCETGWQVGMPFLYIRFVTTLRDIFRYVLQNQILHVPIKGKLDINGSIFLFNLKTHLLQQKTKC